MRHDYDRYEEGDHGTLVMQQPAWKGYSGVGHDTVSPMDYQPRLDFTRPKLYASLDFAKVSQSMLICLHNDHTSSPQASHLHMVPRAPLCML